MRGIDTVTIVPNYYEHTERRFSVRMPWRRHMYDIFTDTLIYCRPQFSIYWYKPARCALVIRLGWSPGIERT